MVNVVLLFDRIIKFIEKWRKIMIPNLQLLVDEASVFSGKYVDMPRQFGSAHEIKAFYDEYGYVTIKGLLPVEFLDNVRSDLTALFSPYALNEKSPIDSGIIELDKDDKIALYNLHTAACKLVTLGALSVDVQDTLKSISGRSDPLLEIANGFFMSIAQDERLVYDFHQESNYMKGFEDLFNVHYPLLRTSDLENGTMSILLGTHHLGNLAYSKSQSSHDSYTDLKPDKIEEISAVVPELHCYLELGDCVIFHKNLIHKSNYNGSSLCRPVGVGRYTQSLTGDWIYRTPEEL